jgi:phosphoglycerol transferase
MNRWRLARETVAIGLVALLAGLWVVRAWELDPTAPVLYEGDALLHLTYVEALREGGWISFNGRLAAPFGQDVRDFPLGGENLHWLALELLGMAMPNAPATATAYLLLTYVLIAAAMYVVARLIRLGRGAAAVVALLFAFLPFHQMRWTMHLLRAGYYTIPLAGLAILWLLDWQRELRDRPDDGPARWRPFRVAFVLASAALLGSSDTQHALYAALVLLPAALLVTVRDRDLRPLTLAFAFSLIAGVALLANNLPYLRARAERGPNHAVLIRNPSAQETYGLRLAKLVLPVEDHRVDVLAEITAAAGRWTPPAPGEAGQALGAVGTLGFLIGLAAVGAAALGGSLLPQAPVPLARLGVLMLTGVLWASVGGFSFLLSLAGLTMYRTWNRMSVWIAFFALLAAGAVLHRLLVRVRRRWLAALIVGVVIVVGLLDQVPREIRTFDPQRLSREWHADATFFRQVEAALPPGAMVYQLPAMAFPEPVDVHGLGAFEPVKPYLHTAALRFSYGGMTGRPEGEWSKLLDPLGAPAATALLALAGFDAALVDRRGYPDAGATIEGDLASVGAVLTIVDPARRRSLWDLRPVRERLGGASGPQSDVGRALFDQPPTRFNDTFYPDERDGAGHRWRWTALAAAEIRIDGGTVPRRVIVSATLDHIDKAATVVTVNAGGKTFTVPIAAGPALFTASLDVPPDGLTLRLTSDGQPQQPPKDERQLGILVRDLIVVDQVALERLCASGVPVTLPCEG